MSESSTAKKCPHEDSPLHDWTSCKDCYDLYMRATRNKRKRDKRRKNRNLRMVAPDNKWQQIEAILERCRQVLQEASKDGDWNNLQWPEGWSYEKYRTTRDYCLSKLEKHREGRMNRIMGGPKQAAAFNAWMWEAVETLQEARKQGLLDDATTGPDAVD